MNRCEKHLPSIKPMCPAAKHKMKETAAAIQSARSGCCDSLAGQITVPVKSLRTPRGLMPPKKWFEGIITPEELTYLKAGILWLPNDRPDTFKKYIHSHFRKTGLWPAAFYVPRRGLFISDRKENLPLYQKVFAYYLQIRGQASHLGGIKPLARKYLSGEGL